MQNTHSPKRFSLICGDFNLTPDLSMYSTSSSRCSVPFLHSLIHQHELFDAWHYLHAGEKDFTFFSLPHQSYSRIDFFLVDQWTLTKTTLTLINTITWSDHVSVVLTIEDSLSYNSIPIWISNPFLLQRNDTKQII